MNHGRRRNPDRRAPIIFRNGWQEAKMSNTNSTNGIQIQTSLGSVVAFWDQQKIRESVFEPLKRELEGSGNDRYDDARFEVSSYIGLILTVCIQEAVEQAKRELIAKGLMRVSYDKHQKWELACKVADVAREDSINRICQFCRVKPPQRGEHRKPSLANWVSAFTESMEQRQSWETKVVETIKESLKRSSKTNPTMGSIGKRLRALEDAEAKASQRGPSFNRRVIAGDRG
jgi:hypothetical protein